MEQKERMDIYNSHVDHPPYINISSRRKFIRSGLKKIKYNGLPDAVECIHCHAILADWKDGDDPVECHKNYAWECSYIQSIGNEKLRDGPPFQNNMKTEAQRLATFSGFPCKDEEQKRALANAGFYSEGNGDELICFCCGIHLSSWSNDDDAWREHTYWSPACHFVLCTKGEKYVRKVVEGSSEEMISDVSEERLMEMCTSCNLRPKMKFFGPCGCFSTCEECSKADINCCTCGEEIHSSINIAQNRLND